MSYMALKHIHLTTIAITFVLFSLRAVWMLMEFPQLQKKWVKIVPHINDTILLISALGLAYLLRQYPFQAGWVTAKVLGLVAYIILGTIALKRGRTKAIRVTAMVGAYLVFFYIVRVALTKMAWPF